MKTVTYVDRACSNGKKRGDNDTVIGDDRVDRAGSIRSSTGGSNQGK